MDTVHVYDTWVNGKKGKLHFDVMTTNEDQALTLAKQYLVGNRRIRRGRHPQGMPILPQRTAGHVFGIPAAAIPRTRRLHLTLSA